MGDGSRMTHDLWATLNQRVVSFSTRSLLQNWWTTSGPGLAVEDKAGSAPRHLPTPVVK